MAFLPDSHGSCRLDTLGGPRSVGHSHNLHRVCSARPLHGSVFLSAARLLARTPAQAARGRYDRRCGHSLGGRSTDDAAASGNAHGPGVRLLERPCGADADNGLRRHLEALWRPFLPRHDARAGSGRMALLVRRLEPRLSRLASRRVGEEGAGAPRSDNMARHRRGFPHLSLPHGFWPARMAFADRAPPLGDGPRPVAVHG